MQALYLAIIGGVSATIRLAARRERAYGEAVRAEYQERLGGGRVRCQLCPHGCVMAEGRRGRCRVRGVEGGSLVALAYGAVSSAGVDPVEKKPLYHFFPGRSIFSVGGWGCNFACTFCQNWAISQAFREGGERHTPEEIAAAAAEAAANGGSVGVAYTYNEPLVGFEFVRDCARLVRQAGLRNVLVTNGFINPAPAADLLPLVDACNIDIKSMAPAFYAEQCRGALDPVLAFARHAKEAGCHVELTNLLIPGLNDTDALLDRLTEWVAEHLGVETPLHLSAYRPEFRMETPATPPGLLGRAARRCAGRLAYVYVGNVFTGAFSDTACAACGATLVQRRGYRVSTAGLQGSACAACGQAAPFVTG